MELRDLTETRSLKLTRMIPAPRDRVFEAWTRPEDIRQWFGRTEGIDVPSADVDLRVGGRYRFVMAAGDAEFPLSGTYLEVEIPTRLVYSFKWERAIPLPGGEEGPETIVTVEFRDLGSETEVVLTHEGFPTDDARSFHNMGWENSFQHLAALLENA